MIYIVIPIYNRKNFTRECIVSLQNQTYKNYKIIIIDDGSTDGTKEMLQTEFPEVLVLYGDGNLFWTKAINMGIKKALALGAEYILTLNNDTIATSDFLEKMIFWAERTHQARYSAHLILVIIQKDPIMAEKLLIGHWLNRDIC